MNDKPESWDALGGDYHKSLERNYVTWVRRYLRQGSSPPKVGQLRGRNISWAVGALFETGSTIGNIQAAGAAGIPIGLLNSRHFPQVSIPDALADYIAKVARA